MKAILLFAQLLFVATTFSYEMNLEKVDLNFFEDLQRSKFSKIESIIKKDPFSKEFLPSNSVAIEVDENEHLHKYIDEIFLEMISTPFGQSLCFGFGDDNEPIRDLLGVQEKTSNIIAKSCYGYLSKKISKSEIANLKPLNKFKKSYVFVFNSKLENQLDSWTSMTNVTYIFVDHLMTRVDLFKRVLHEFYVSYDQKFLFGNQTANYILSSNYKVSSTNYFGRGSQSELKEIAGVHPYPLIKSSFLVMRATLFELWVLNEFQKHKGALKEVNFSKLYDKITNDCESVLEDTMNSLFKYQLHLLPFEYSILPVEIRAYEAQNLLLNEKAPKIISNIFRESKLQLIDLESKDKYSACQYLSIPELGNLSTFYSRGPRPRIKTGWGNSSEAIANDVEIPELNVDLIISNKNYFNNLIDETVDSELILKRKNDFNLDNIENLYKLNEER